MFKKPITGYEKKPRKRKVQNTYIAKLITRQTKAMSFGERLVKFLIYIALRLTIKPSKWKNPEKNYEIIDRTYRRIMSPDFVFIPSSVAFYLIMAFMPILSIIIFIYQIPSVHTFFIYDDKDLIKETLSKMIPGINTIISQIEEISKSSSWNSTAKATAVSASILSLFLSIWVASNGFSKIIFIQSHIFEHKFVGGYWANKAKGIAIVILFSILSFFGLFLNVVLQKEIRSTIWGSSVKNGVIIFTMLLILFFGIFFGFVLLFKYSPRFKIRFRHVLPGSMVSTIPTVGFLGLFGTISSLWNYGSYGAIGAIMYIGMSSLILSYFVFVGIIANAAYYKTFVGPKVEVKWTLSKK